MNKQELIEKLAKRMAKHDSCCEVWNSHMNHASAAADMLWPVVEKLQEIDAYGDEFGYIAEDALAILKGG